MQEQLGQLEPPGTEETAEHERETGERGDCAQGEGLGDRSETGEDSEGEGEHGIDGADRPKRVFNRGTPNPQASARLKPKKNAITQLPPRWESFVTELIANGGWQTKAAIAAGYAPTSAHVTASHLMDRPEIQARIQEALNASTVTPEEIVGILAGQARFDIADLLNENGEFDYKIARKNRATKGIRKYKQRKRTILTRGGPVETVETDLETYSSYEAAARLATILGIDQEARKNQIDAERERRLIADKITELARTLECSEHAALGHLRAWKPEWEALAEYELPAVEGELLGESDAA